MGAKQAAQKNEAEQRQREVVAIADDSEENPEFVEVTPERFYRAMRSMQFVALLMRNQVAYESYRQIILQEFGEEAANAPF